MRKHLPPLKHLLIGMGVVAILAGCAPIFDDQNKMDQSGTGTPTPATGAVAPTTTQGEIDIGALFPLSGEAANYGIAAQRVLAVGLKKINDAGGVMGKQLGIVYEDGGCDASIANKAIYNLVSVRKVQMIIGGFCSSETLTAAPVVEQDKVVLLSPASSNPKISEAGDFVFRNYPSDNAQGEVIADYAANKGYKKVGLLVEEQPYPEGIADAFQAKFTQKGGESFVEKYAKDASDFRTQITKLQEEKVDAFYVDPQAPAKGDLIIKQLLEAGVKGPFMLNDVVIGAQKEIIEKYKDQLEGSVGALVLYDKANPELKILQDEYKKLSGGEEMPYLPYMAPTYDALFIYKEAIEKVGLDPVKIKDYLYTIKDRKGLAGNLTFDKNGDPDSSHRHVLQQIHGGVVGDYSDK